MQVGGRESAKQRCARYLQRSSGVQSDLVTSRGDEEACRGRRERRENRCPQLESLALDPWATPSESGILLPVVVDHRP